MLAGGAAVIARGTQILYVPMHAQGDTNHPDCEAGFVTSVRGDVAFCRYWNKQLPAELRTKANSEATPIDALVEQWNVPQRLVDEALAAIDAEALAVRLHTLDEGLALIDAIIAAGEEVEQ